MQDSSAPANRFSGLQDKDLGGLELLMNPRKKVAGGSDAISISSRSSLHEADRISVRSGANSVKSINIGNPQPEFIDVGAGISRDNDDFETEDDVDFDDDESFDSRPPKRQQQSYFQKASPASDESGSQLESLGSFTQPQEQQRPSQPRLTEEEVILLKKELLYQFERLEKKGMKLPKKFTLASNLEEMKMEYERLKRDKEVDNSVKLQRRMMMAAVSGLEWLNGRFDPLGAKLDGWSDSIYENIDDYDDIFEELHEKYKGKAKFAPELKLLMMLGGSAFMHHMTHSMFSNQLPGLDSILKQNPELAKQLAAATSQHMAQQQSSAGNLFGNLGSMFTGMFGGMGQGPPPPMPESMQMPKMPPVPPMAQHSGSRFAGPQKVNMKGPSNVDDLLREFEEMSHGDAGHLDNDRIEMMSAVTGSELVDLAVDDTSSINGIIASVGGGKRGGRRGKSKKGLTIDI